MGNVVSLEQHREKRSQAQGLLAADGPRELRPAVTFAFDLSSPWTYLAAERVERLLPDTAWQPVVPEPAIAAAQGDDERVAVEARAGALGMPLIWPERRGGGGQGAARAAAWAAEQGQAPAFVLAACRLAFCGGFDLEDPETIAEAAAAAGLGLDACLLAALDPVYDEALVAAGRRLRARGADRLPVVSAGDDLFCGEQRLAEAAAALSAPAYRRRSRDGRAG